MPSLPLPPRPVGQLTVEPAPILDFHSSFTFAVAGEHEGSTGTIGATNHGDILRRQLHTRVEFSDRFVIPLLILPVDITQSFTVQNQLTRLHARQVDCQNHATDHGRELEQAFLSQFVIGQRSIRSTEIDGVSNNLFYTTGRANAR